MQRQGHIARCLLVRRSPWKEFVRRQNLEKVISMNVLFWLVMSLGAHVSATQEVVLKDSVDLVEVNHYHDARGQHVFDQLIFYDWSSQKKRFQVRAWRLIKSDNQLPRRDHRSGTWLVRWHDDGAMREVVAKSRRETWTQYDPELVERDNLPQEQRLDLSSWQSAAEKLAAVERVLLLNRDTQFRSIGAE
jgi:hypothetical protein